MPVRNFIRLIVRLSLYGFLAGLTGTACLFYYYSRDLPDYSTLESYYPPAVTRLYSSDGILIEEYAKEYRVFVPIDTIPKSLKDAFIAAEDRNFYDHLGVDIPGIIRAALANVSRVLQGRRMEGGSTITQQVVKHFFLTSEQSIVRKIKEAILAYRITRTYTKDQILELYLNQIYLGKGAYGVAAAANAYFNKSIDELNLPESAMIAALPKAPSAFDPDKRYERVLSRRNYVINRMVEEGYVTREIANEAIETPIILKKRAKTASINADYFAETVREKIIELFGKEMFYTGGLSVITTMDSNYQKQAQKSLRKSLREYDRRKGYRGPIAKIDLDNWKENLNSVQKPVSILEYELATILDTQDSKAIIGLKDGSKSFIAIESMKWGRYGLTSAKDLLQPGDVVIVEKAKRSYRLRQIPKVNGGFILMDQHNGRILAQVGGYDFKASKFNRVTQAKRQPGSSIKPFIYLAALEHNLQPNKLYDDAPISIPQGPNLPDWEPRNYSGDFLGTLTMRKAFEKSRNIITVKVAQDVGIDKVAEIIKRFGINVNPPPYYSLCLGAIESTMEKLASAYAAIANGGYKITPHYIEMIKDAKGNILYRRPSGICDCEAETSSNPPDISPYDKIRLSDEASIFQMVSLMQGGAIRGSSRRSQVIGKIVAGKTGTTNDSMDTWFAGFTPKILGLAYVGHDTPQDLGKRDTGAVVALPIFIDFMQNAYKEPSLPFKAPDSLIEKRVDHATGKESKSEDAIIEYFKPGYYNPNPRPPESEAEPLIEDDSGIY